MLILLDSPSPFRESEARVWGPGGEGVPSSGRLLEALQRSD
jgi:hypothetical protein